MRSREDYHCLEKLRESVADAALHAPQVSGWSVGMHVHHCALGMVRICGILLESTAPAPRSGFSAPAAFVLMTGRIPRGRGKAPAGSHPDSDIQVEDLHALLEQSEEQIRRAAEADPETWWQHPVLGVLSRDKSLRFIRIHNRHHLAIIRDIRAAS